MFRRKEEGGDTLTDEIADDFLGNSGEVQIRSVSSIETRAPQPSEASRPAAPAQPTFRPAPPQAAMAASRPAPQPAAAQAPVAAASSKNANGKRVLTVGPDIQMKGEITTCDRVVIEGMVDATMKDVHTVELAQSGSLKGVAEVEDAEISGSFEGDLIVRGRLIVYATGRIRGNVTYSEIEIERGGQIAGSIRNVSEATGKGAQLSKRIL